MEEIEVIHIIMRGEFWRQTRPKEGAPQLEKIQMLGEQNMEQSLTSYHGACKSISSVKSDSTIGTLVMSYIYLGEW